MARKIDELIAGLKQAEPMLGAMMGFEYNYKPQSLKKLEEAIITLFGGRELRGETITMLGAYLGEVIRQNVKGAEWVDFKEYVNEAHLIIPTDDHGKIQINPFSRIEKFSRDHTDTIYGFYCMIQDMKNNRLPSGEEAAEKGVVKGKSPRGYEYKMISVYVSDELKARHEKGEITQSEMIQLAKEEYEAKKED